MTTDEAIRILREMYRQGLASGESRTQAHLFGIMYAAELARFTIKQLDAIGLEATDGKARKYGTEIDKGRRLAKYVKLKPGV